MMNSPKEKLPHCNAPAGSRNACSQLIALARVGIWSRCDSPRRAFGAPLLNSGSGCAKRHDDDDFVHKIGTRQPLFDLYEATSAFTLWLRPGHLRSVLSDYIVESLSVQPFPVAHRLLATWLQSVTTFRTQGRPPSPLHLNRIGTALLGTHFMRIILLMDEKLPACIR